jgi:hypothetical protein
MMLTGNIGWRRDAACRDRIDLDWFADVPSAECMDLCAVCPVAGKCLSEALDRQRDWDPGIWGGTTPRERYAIREGTSWQRTLL